VFSDGPFAQAPFSTLAESRRVFSAEIFESSSVSSITSARGVFRPSVAESAFVLSDKFSFGNILFAAMSEGVVGTALTPASAILRAALLEAAGISSANTVTLQAVASQQELATGASTTTAQGVFRPSVAESAFVLSDKFSFGNIFLADMAEGVTGVSVSAASAILRAAILESAGASSAATVIMQAYAFQQELATGTSSFLSQVDFVSAVVAGAAGAASVQAQLDAVATMPEGASISTTATARVFFVAQQAENASAQDALEAIKEINVHVTGVQLLLRIGDVLIWSSIPTPQNPDWQPVVDTQNPTWVAVNNNQVPVWQVVADSQSANWQNVDNLQGPGWSDIPS
jgi:hypothetical protein